MILSEIFYSIQGEGVNIGTPAIFIRFGNCNLRCRWCDSKFARCCNRNISLKDLIKEIRKFGRCKHIVITGGEPMLQQDVISAIRNKFPIHYIEVETNGSQEAKCKEDVDLFTVSYKTSNSGNKPYPLKTVNSKCVYKFVIESKKDFPEVEGIIENYKLPPAKIYLMPQGVEPEELLKKHLFIIEYCKKKGYHFTPRLHVLTWGNIRNL